MSGTGSDNGWLEAAVAWEVCASLHRQYCKGKDALFTTRQSDYVKHAENARGRASHGQAPASVLHLVNSAFAEIAMAFPKAFALHKVGIADKAVLEALAAPATQQVGEVRRAELVPGVMHCAKCKFQLNRVTLCVSDGNAYAGNNKTEPCPNGCGPLWPVTWEQEAKNCWKALEEMHERLMAAAAPQPSPTAQAAESVPAVDRDRIREIFMAHGFTVKEGQGDLKQYVYDAADALLRAARAPADSVLEDAAWMPLTPELLTAIESGDLGNRFWIAAHNNNEPQIVVYEWRQGRNPHGFNSDVGRYGASEITHVLPYKPPALPAARKQGANHD